MSEKQSLTEEPHPMLRTTYVLFGALVAAIAVLAYLFVVFSTAERANPFVDRRPFAGCYFADGAESFVLVRDGRVMVGSRTVGTYDIRGPVGGKHGYLLELRGTGFAEEEGKAALIPEGRAQILDITPPSSTSVHVDTGVARFRREACPDTVSDR